MQWPLKESEPSGGRGRSILSLQVDERKLMFIKMAMTMMQFVVQLDAQECANEEGGGDSDFDDDDGGEIDRHV